MRFIKHVEVKCMTKSGEKRLKREKMEGYFYKFFIHEVRKHFNI